MKGYRVCFTPEAAQVVARLHPDHRKNIRAALDLLQDNPYSGDDLQGELAGFKSFKPKRFRIIYNLEPDLRIIPVYFVGHRRDVYDQFRRLLGRFNV